MNKYKLDLINIYNNGRKLSFVNRAIIKISNIMISKILINSIQISKTIIRETITEIKNIINKNQSINNQINIILQISKLKNIKIK